MGRGTKRAPDLTIHADLTLRDGDRRIELHHPGHCAHTAGDLVARLPEQRVLFAGDLLFPRVTPLVFMGSLDGALPDAERIVLNLHRAYADISGQPFDMLQAFADAITFNAGPLRTRV